VTPHSLNYLRAWDKRGYRKHLQAFLEGGGNKLAKGRGGGKQDLYDFICIFLLHYPKKEKKCTTKHIFPKEKTELSREKVDGNGL